jgi:hypothetical protein
MGYNECEIFSAAQYLVITNGLGLVMDWIFWIILPCNPS